MPPRKLGDILIARGVLDREKLEAALSDQRAFGGKLGRTLVDLAYVTEDQLMAGLAEQLGLETIDLDQTTPTPEALSCLPVDACERYGVFPVRVDAAERLLWIATAEPDRSTLLEVARISQHTVEPMLASMSSIDRMVRRAYFGEQIPVRTRLGEPLANIPLGAPAPRSVSQPGPEPHHPEAQLEDDLGHVTPEEAAPAGELEELRNLIIRLEKTVAAQSRAFRALVDILQDKGVVRRGELGQRATRARS